MKKVKMLANLGALDAVAYDIKQADATEGAVLELDDRQFDALVNRLKCAEAFDEAKERKRLSAQAAEESSVPAAAPMRGHVEESASPREAKRKG